MQSGKIPKYHGLSLNFLHSIYNRGCLFDRVRNIVRNYNAKPSLVQGKKDLTEFNNGGNRGP
jgi:hypothetical protein